LGYVIRSFKCRDTEALFNGKRVARFANIERVATRKLQMLDDATALQDLAAPPANRLEALKGNRRGQNSIRINDQWRLCFVWAHAGPERVEIVDYH
jgi:proteic killer suppression protein